MKPFLTSGYSITLPVFRAQRREDQTFLIQTQVEGSAFPLGGEFMVTAAHVSATDSASDDATMVVGIQAPDGYFKAAEITEVEDIGADIAVLRVSFSVPESNDWFNRFKWSRSQLDPFTPVRTVRYAYGTHTIDGNTSVVVRGFHGEVVSRLNEFRPLTMKGSPFQVYELSFLAPRGLSGAPLLNAQGKVQIHGVIIGNTDTRMMVFRSQETIQEDAKTTIVEQYDALSLGVAVTADDILPRKSRLLGASVEKHLAVHELIA